MKYSSKDHTFIICAYKEREYLEKCLVSVLNQTIKSNIMISTSTPNEFIEYFASRDPERNIVPLQ